MTDENDRIRAEYARREREIPTARYEVTAPENVLASQELERLALDALDHRGLLPLAGRRVLDVGCGNGGWLARFESWGVARGDSAGLDLVPDRAAAAAARAPGADIRTGDAAALPWPDGGFDVVFQSMVFSSILDPGKRSEVAAEIARVLAPGGVLLWYDFFVSDPRNASVVGIRRREIQALFDGFDLHLRRATLAPPLARKVVPRSRTLGAVLLATRLLDTHYVGTLTRRG